MPQSSAGCCRRWKSTECIQYYLHVRCKKKGGVDPGDGIYEFGEASDWVEQRRFCLGTRVSF